MGTSSPFALDLWKDWVHYDFGGKASDLNKEYRVHCGFDWKASDLNEEYRVHCGFEQKDPIFK